MQMFLELLTRGNGRLRSPMMVWFVQMDDGLHATRSNSAQRCPRCGEFPRDGEAGSDERNEACGTVEPSESDVEDADECGHDDGERQSVGTERLEEHAIEQLAIGDQDRRRQEVGCAECTREPLDRVRRRPRGILGPGLSANSERARADLRPSRCMVPPIVQLIL